MFYSTGIPTPHDIIEAENIFNEMIKNDENFNYVEYVVFLRYIAQYIFRMNESQIRKIKFLAQIATWTNDEDDYYEGVESFLSKRMLALRNIENVMIGYQLATIIVDKIGVSRKNKINFVLVKEIRRLLNLRNSYPYKNIPTEIKEDMPVIIELCVALYELSKTTSKYNDIRSLLKIATWIDDYDVESAKRSSLHLVNRYFKDAIENSKKYILGIAMNDIILPTSVNNGDWIIVDRNEFDFVF